MQWTAILQWDGMETQQLSFMKFNLQQKFETILQSLQSRNCKTTPFSTLSPFKKKKSAVLVAVSVSLEHQIRSARD